MQKYILGAIGVILYLLLIFVYPQGIYKPMVFGCIPAPFFAWWIWTFLFMAFNYVVFFMFDPYEWMDD